MLLFRDLLLRALNGRILKIFMWKYLNESNKVMNKLSFQIIWGLTWSIWDRNSWSHQSDTWNYPFNMRAEFPSISSYVVIEEPPPFICVHSLLFIDCIISIGTYGFKCARNNTRIPSIFALCLNFELSSILKCNFEINLENEFKKYLRTIWRYSPWYTNLLPKIIFENYDFFNFSAFPPLCILLQLNHKVRHLYFWIHDMTEQEFRNRRSFYPCLGSSSDRHDSL